MQVKRYTITAALPYTNGPIHIGHLAGVYVPSDIYSRYLDYKAETFCLFAEAMNTVWLFLWKPKEGITAGSDW
jgi:methionyl-tRNA synthetase